MPDRLKQTLSATQTPALFGASPYLTRWMLLRHFIHGDPIDSPQHNRMNWGMAMQPLLLAQAASDLHLEVRPNASDDYIRRGLLGCTRDADIICPSRGPGSLETKCVFDYGVWMDKWDGGKVPPRHYEIQLQQQMLVGDGAKSHEWGVLAAWVCGEMHYFERKPIPELWEKITEEAHSFFADVAAKLEGEPFGNPVELPLLTRLFAPVAGKAVSFRDHPEAERLAREVSMFKYHSTESLLHKKAHDDMRAKILTLMADASEAEFLHGIKVSVKQSERAGYTVKPSRTITIKAFVPDATRLDEQGPPTKAAKNIPENILAG